MEGTVAAEGGVEEAQEAKEEEEEDRSADDEDKLEFPPSWTMKNLADHATETHSDFKHVLEFGRLGIFDFEEQEHTLEWILGTFRDVELFRDRHLRENADVESEARLDERLREMRLMADEMIGYYRRRGRILMRNGTQITLKF